jgi:8-oxo-dGTP pyrophosphatase MutT (NUDIX family)
MTYLEAVELADVQREALKFATGTGAKVRASLVLMCSRHSGPYVWLAQRRSLNADVLPGLWETGGGKLEERETWVDAAIREARQEAGVRLTQDRLVPHGVVRLYSPDVQMAIFSCVLLPGERPVNVEGESKRSNWQLHDPTWALKSLAMTTATAAAILLSGRARPSR